MKEKYSYPGERTIRLLSAALLATTLSAGSAIAAPVNPDLF